MTGNVLRILSTALCLMLLFCVGCDNGNSSSEDTSSTESLIPTGEALSDSELAFEEFLYSDDGVYIFDNESTPTLVFNEAKSFYGEKSINIIGDSISHGMSYGNIYNNSWTILFKNSFNKYYGTNNFGYVSLLSESGYGDAELHKVSAKSGSWAITRHVVTTPGFCTYSSSDKSGSTMVIKVDRRTYGFDRYINGFYIYYVSGPSSGGFDVSVNGTKAATVTAGGDSNDAARTEYIAVPDGLKGKLEIEISKTDSKEVTIGGIAYAESDSGVMINNYSLSGMTLCEVDDSLLKKLCRSNYVILSLGYNDAGSSQDINTFISKLKVVSDACSEYGSTLIVTDFLWPKGTNTSWATKYKNELFNCAKNSGGYYIDFTDMYKTDSAYLLADTAHPTSAGFKLIARKLCYFFGIPFTSEVG